jgi:hypothetical protein
MPGFDGTGPAGMGPMTGGGRGFCRPQGVRASPRRYSFYRRVPYAYPRHGASREEELELLKSEAQALRYDLKELEAEIERLSTGKK